MSRNALWVSRLVGILTIYSRSSCRDLMASKLPTGLCKETVKESSINGLRDRCKQTTRGTHQLCLFSGWAYSLLEKLCCLWATTGFMLPSLGWMFIKLHVASQISIKNMMEFYISSQLLSRQDWKSCYSYAFRVAHNNKPGDGMACVLSLCHPMCMRWHIMCHCNCKKADLLITDNQWLVNTDL